MSTHPYEAAVIGAGPAGLMAAEMLSAGGARVAVYDRMPSAGRKFLMAGRGGLNLTHSEPFARFVERYGESSPALRAIIEAFSPDDARAWAHGLGQDTFVGSSGRVFPKAFKASPLLRAWLARLRAAGVTFHLRHHWRGWDDKGALRFDTPDGDITHKPDVTVLALGGASWPRLGSDGAWVRLLQDAGAHIVPLRPANCGFDVAWSPVFRERFQGHPLKRIALSFGKQTVRGEAMVTRAGIEGGVVYALSQPLREAVDRDGGATLQLDVLPDIALQDVIRRLAAPRGKQSLSTFLRKALSLSPVAIALLHEAMIRADATLTALDPSALAALIKGVPVVVNGVAPVESAISTAGGVAWSSVDESLMLRARPGVFVAGEMLDWEAPTGGYLLQACLATGRHAGLSALARGAAA